MVQLSFPYMTTLKTIALTIWTSVSKVTSLLSDMLSRFVIAFLDAKLGSVQQIYLDTYSVSFLRLLGGREEEREGSREGGREDQKEEGRKRKREQTKKQQLKDTEQVEGTGMNDCHGLYPLKLLSERRRHTQDIGPHHPWSWGGQEMGFLPIGINGFLAC